MADNVAVTAGAGTTIGTDDIGGVHIQRVKATWGPDGTANDADVATGKPLPVQLRGSDGGDLIKNEDVASASGDAGIPILVKRTDTPAASSGTDGDYEPLQSSGGGLWVKPLSRFVTVSTDITRPADTTQYAANDCLSDSTSAPTAGGFTFTSAARASGGSGIITDCIVASSNDPATPIQGEVWIFDTSVTNVNDNAAFVVSDSEIKTLVATIPFTLTDSGNNDSAHIQNLAIGFTCSGSANLRYLIRVKNAYTPASAEVLTVRLKIIQVD